MLMNKPSLCYHILFFYLMDFSLRFVNYQAAMCRWLWSSWNGDNIKVIHTFLITPLYKLGSAI